jgi:prolyl oligopeptidase
MEALALHEAVPGHHLQLALQNELEGLPSWRTTTHFTAYIEGWGLYSESLGEAMGFYQDPYSRFGQLSYEMWRALRLVVDTGLHELGWSRQQAIDVMLENSALTRKNVEAEVDRYISWPGQALAYKIGEMEIQDLVRSARTQLGNQFDIREFHDHLLAEGSMPLDILRDRMERWIVAQLESQNRSDAAVSEE